MSDANENPTTPNVISTKQKRPSIVRGYVFKSVFGDDPELCRELLEIVLGTRIRSVEVVQPEREVDVARAQRAGRLDVFAIDADGNRFDVEIQAQPREKELLRARHYQALMDVQQLRRGARVEGLRDSVVVFVCDFDPLGDGLRVYDCRTVCLQTKAPVDDGRRIVLLNSRGKKGEVSPALDAFLRFVAGEDVQGDAFVDRVSASIDSKVSDPAWMEGYMDYYDELEAERRAARMEGRAEGYGEGKVEGKAEGRIETRLEDAATLVRKGVMGEDAAAELLGVDLADLHRALADLA